MERFRQARNEATGEWLRLAAHPAVWAGTALVILTAQTGYWLDVSWDPNHRPTDPAAMFHRGAGALSFWCPLIGILFMAAATDGRNPHRLGPARVARNMAAVSAVLLITALASSLALLPGSLTATLVYPWNEIEPAQPERWLPSLEIIGKALWIGAAYASFGALIVTATGSKIAAGALAIIWSLFENIIVDLATGWWSALWWIDGLLPSNMYIHWQGDPLTTPGSMKNLFGLEDATQAILVLGAHIAVTAAATLALARWKSRRQQGRAETAPKAPDPVLHAPRPGRRTWKYAGLIALALALAPAAIGTAVTAGQEKPTPRMIAERHIRLNMAETAREVTRALAPGHPKEKQIAAEIRASMAGSLRGYVCGGENDQLRPGEEMGVRCTVRATLLDSLGVHLEIPITVGVQDGQPGGRGRPTVTGIEAHPEQAKTSKLDGSPIPEEDQIPDNP